MMFFWECASSSSGSNRHATRAFGPLGFLDHLQHPTFRHLTPVSTKNSWLFTASMSHRSGSCGTSCTTPNWAATTGQVWRPGLLSGGEGQERRRERRQTMVRSGCSSCISDFLQDWRGFARALQNGYSTGSAANLKWLFCVQKHSWVIEEFVQAGRSTRGKWIGKYAWDFSVRNPEENLELLPSEPHLSVDTVLVNNHAARFWFAKKIVWWLESLWTFECNPQNEVCFKQRHLNTDTDNMTKCG